MSFYIGENVEVISSDTVEGLRGTVVALRDARKHTVGVNFSEEVEDGHDCDGQGLDYHCRWLSPKQIVPVIRRRVSGMSPGFSSIEARGGSVLKKLTNFVKTHLQEPMKSFYRLGWVEIVDDELVTAAAGREADFQARVVLGTELAKYATQEIARIEKEEKSKKS